MASFNDFFAAPGTDGAGLKNYIDNPGAETTTTGWATYADAAATTPVDGIGGTPSVTLTRTTSSPLSGVGSFLITKDAVNRQGNGVSTDFVIDLADINRQLTISFDWLVNSGTYTAGDVTVHVYDASNGKLVPIASNNSIDANGHAVLQFSTTSSTSYRLIFHIASTSASAWTAKLDNVSVGPVDAAVCFAGSDWVDFTPTIYSLPTSTLVGKWRRVGSDMEVHITWVAGGAGTGNIYIDLPPGYFIDESRLAVGPGAVDAALGVAAAHKPGVVWGTGGTVFYGAGTIKVQSKQASATGQELWNATVPFTWVSGCEASISFKCPIVGWSGTQAVQPGHRYRWAERFAATATRVTTTPTALGQYRYTDATVDGDPINAPSALNGLYHQGFGGSTVRVYYIFIGTNKAFQLEAYPSAGRSGYISTDVVLDGSSLFRGLLTTYSAATGVLTVTVAASAGMSPTTLANVAACYFDIIVADDPVPVAQAPAVHVEASSNSGQNIPELTWTTINYEDTITDTHNAYSGGVFTVPVAGVYQVNHIFALSSAASALVIAGIRINSSINLESGNNGAESYASISMAVRLSAGDTVELRGYQAFGTRSLQTTVDYNRMSITRIGD